ncbi:MAG: acyl-CoA reductase [Myxococcota bacterium]
MSAFRIPMFIRGEIIEEDWVPFGARNGAGGFEAPDPAKYVDRLPLATPMDLADLYEISFDEIVDVLVELGKALDPDKNAHVQEAMKAAAIAAPYPPAMLRNSYTTMPYVFDRDAIVEIAESRIGVDYLEGWVSRTLRDGREIRVRAFGARALHVPAGNGGLVSAITIIRNAITRSDAIVKVPSNDPMTAIAIAKTLADVAPNHPVTKHLAVAYWKGGDTRIEEHLYRPEHVEKIVAWGGFASVKHVTRYIQPGLELISLDPKRSATIIGPEAFESEETLDEVAVRAATDIGMANQEACASARVIYLLCGTDADGIERANRIGERIYQKLVGLPEHLSTKPRYFDRDLRDHLEGSRMTEDFYRVIGGEEDEGAVIVSQMDEPVDYAPMLSGRVANIVPVDDIKKVTDAVNAYTQTVGIYPESLKRELRNQLPLFGAQRLTSLGYACHVTSAMPQDAIEPVRRMCKWIVDEECDPERVFPLWQTPAL